MKDEQKHARLLDKSWNPIVVGTIPVKGSPVRSVFANRAFRELFNLRKKPRQCGGYLLSKAQDEELWSFAGKRNNLHELTEAPATEKITLEMRDVFNIRFVFSFASLTDTTSVTRVLFAEFLPCGVGVESAATWLL